MELKELRGKTWERVLSICENEAVLLALSGNDDLLEAAKLSEGYGSEAGACYIVASLVAEENAIRAINLAIHQYRKLSEKHKMPRILKHQISELEGWTSWRGHGSYPSLDEFKWTIKPPVKFLEDDGGFLNFLLFCGIKRLDTTQPLDSVVASGVIRFLDWMRKSGGLRAIKNQGEEGMIDLTEKKWQTGAKWKKSKQVWRVSEVTAGIITMVSGNKRRKDMILHPSEVEKAFQFCG